MHEPRNPVLGRRPARDARLRSAGSVLFLLVVTLWRLWPGIEATPFHRDEARWIGNAALLREWRHPLGIKWQDEGYIDQYGTIDERSRRRGQFPLAMYVFGIGLLLQGQGLPTNGYWIMTEDTRWNAAQGNMPTIGQLRAARRTSVVIAALTVVALFAIGSRLTNRVGGMAGALLYALHPLTLSTSTRAWSDALLVLCVAGAALAAYRLAECPTWWRAAALGAALGLGGATKLSPLALAVVLGGFGMMMVLWRLLIRPRGVTIDTQAHGMRLGIRLAAAPAVAGLAFVLLYPYLWPDPLTHTQRMVSFRRESFALQGNDRSRVNGPTDALSRAGHQLGERYSVGGLIADGLDERLGDAAASSLRELDLLVSIVGWLVVLALVARRGLASPSGMMAMVVGGQAGLTILAMGVDHPRYWLPVLLAVALGVCVAGGAVWAWVHPARWHAGMVEAGEASALDQRTDQD